MDTRTLTKTFTKTIALDAIKTASRGQISEALDAYLANLPWRPNSIFDRSEQEIEVDIDFNRQKHVILDRSCDLADDMVFQVDIPALPEGYRWVPYLGAALIEILELSIGGSKINQLNGELLNILHHLYFDEETVKDYHQAIGHDPMLFYSWEAKESRTIEIPLKFLFNDSIPMCALMYHRVDIHLKLEKLAKLVQRRSEKRHVKVHLSNTKLIVKGTRLNHGDRNQLCIGMHDYLIRQFTLDYDQFNVNKVYQMSNFWKKYYVSLVCTKGRMYLPKWIQTRVASYLVGFDRDMHGVKFSSPLRANGLWQEIIMVVDNHGFQEQSNDDQEPCPSKWGHCWGIVEAGLKVKDMEMYKFKDSELIWEHQKEAHTGKMDGVYVLPLSEKPEQLESDDGFSTSKIESLELVGTLAGNMVGYCDVRIYSVGQTIFRCMSGMGGLCFL